MSLTTDMVTVVVPGVVDINRALLLFGEAVDTNAPSCGTVSGALNDSGGLLVMDFKRILSTLCNTPYPAVELRWYVVEFWPGVTVERGAISFNGPVGFQAVPLLAGDNAARLPFSTSRARGGQYNAGDFFITRVSSQGEFQAQRDPTGSDEVVMEWQVLNLPGLTSTTQAISFPANALSQPTALGMPDPARTLLSLGWTVAANSPSIGTVTPLASYTPVGMVQVKREVSGQAINVEVTAATLPPPLLVEAGDVVISPGVREVSILLANPVEAGHAFAMGGYRGHAGSTTQGGTSGVGGAWATFTLTPPATLTVRRGGTQGTSRFHFEVVRDH